MATGSKRDVRLAVEIDTVGEETLRRAADEVRRLAREGGDAAPALSAAAAELDKLTDQAAALGALKGLTEEIQRLSAEQAEAASRARAVGEALTAQREKVEQLRAQEQQLQETRRAARTAQTEAINELQRLRASTDAAGKASLKYASDIQAQVDKQTQARSTLTDVRNELEKLRPVITEAANAEARLGKQFDALNDSAAKGQSALRSREQALASASAAALAAGAASTDLAQADQALLASAQRLVGETNELIAAERERAAGAAEGAAAVRELEAASRRAERAYQEEQQALLASVAAQREAAAAAARKAQADFDAAEAADSLAAAQQRGRAAAESELAAIRESEQFMQRYAAAQREAAAAADALAAAEGEEAMRRLTAAARLADAEFRELTASLRTAEAATDEYALATIRAASAGADDQAATQARLRAADALVASERELTVAQRELAASRNTSRAALVAEAQALLSVAAAARQSQAATTASAVAARQAGEAIQRAFGAVGIRSIDAIEAEIEQTSAALTRLEVAARRGALGQDELARAAGAAEVKLARLRGEIQQVQATPGRFEQLSNGINDIISRFAGLGAAIATVGVAVQPVLNATIALDQMRRVLTTVTGSAQVAEEQIGALRQIAQQSGQVFTEVGQSYAKFAASALQSGLSISDVNDVFKSVALAAGNLGLSSDQAKRALEALSQIASKGVVSLEELRQQLGDALPGVLPLLAKELGLTQSELIKVVESGQLLAREAIPAIGRSLQALQPQNGVVNGLVANFNRFKNVLLEAGTAIVEGPLGQTAGVVLTAFGGAIRDVTVVAVSASEAFKLLGLSVVTTLDALAGNISFREAGKRIGEFAEQAGARINAFKETAFGADEALNQLGRTAGFTGQSFARLTLEQQKLISAADGAAQSAAKGVEARKAEAEASSRLAGLLGDETAQRLAAVDAALAVADATQNQLRADEAYLQSLRNLRDETIRKAGADTAALEGVKALVEETDKKIAKAEADVDKTRAQAEAARAFAAAQQLAADAAVDNSARIEEFRAAVERAAASQRSAARQYAEGRGSLETLRAATEDLARAKGLLRDAINDLDAALKREIDTLKADNEVKRAGLELELAQARNALRVAQEKGRETAARAAGIRVAELEQALRRTGAAATLQEAEATLLFVAAKEAELRAIGQLTPEIEKELELQRKAALATVLKTQAQIESNKADDDALLRLRNLAGALDGATASTTRSTAAINDNTQSARANSDALTSVARSTDAASLARERYNKLLREDPSRLVGGDGIAGIRNPGANTPSNLPEIDSFGKLIRGTPNGGITRTGSGQLQPPDNSGRWVFNTNRRGEGPFGLGVWELTPEAAAEEAEFIRNPDRFRTGMQPAPAPSPSGLVGPQSRTVRIELAVGNQVLPVEASESAAAQFLAAVERAQRTGS